MSMYRARSWLLVAAIAAAAIAGAWLLKPILQPAVAPVLQSGQLYPEAKLLTPFSLLDQHGQLFTNERLRGKWSFVFFGYTTCPDICPTTLTVFTQLYKQLPPALQADTQMVFATVDPERDTVAQLQQYMPFFHADFIGVTGEPAAVDAFARSFGVAYSKIPQEGGSYLVDHSVRVFLINPDGGRHALFAPTQGSGFEAPLVSADYQRIRAALK
ncbi:MAG TPA: SCO family protein [Permianibacter sp.]|nr:SCO family protein [Permianibacter sp.]